MQHTQHGQFQGRIEDGRFVTGQGCYVDDLQLADMVHAVVARAPGPGKILSLDVSAAREAPGVLGVWTAEDLAANGEPTHMLCGVKLPDLTRDEAFQTARPVLATGTVRYTGEAVAFIVAESRDAARDASELVELDLDEIETVTEARDARAPGAPKVWEEVEGNVAFVWGRGDWDKAEAAIAAAPRRVSLDSHVTRVLAHSMEPRGCVAEMAGGRMVLHASTQSPHASKGQIAAIFGIEASEVRVIARDVGGSFGMKIGCYVEDILSLLAARSLGRPVKWIAERSEDFLTDMHGRDTTIDAALGFDDDGNLLGVSAHYDMNIGAYLGGLAVAAGPANFPGITGVYRVGPSAARAYGVYTHIHTLGPYRGAGRPEATYVIERLIDMAAAELGIDPFELRLKNLVPPEAMPYDTGVAYEYDCGEFEENMRQAADISDSNGFFARKTESAAQGKLRGLGFANPIEVAGGPYGNPGADHTRITVNPDGTVVFHAGAMSVGQGLQTMFTDMVGQAFGVTRDQVTFSQGDTDDLPGGRGSGGSASAPTGGSTAMMAIREVIRKGSDKAADMLEAAPGDIEFSDGTFTVVGTDRSVTLGQVAAKSAGDGDPLAGQTNFTPEKVTFPNGCHIAEIEIDPETGGIEVLGYTVVEDVGHVFNLTTLTGQMHGGVCQGAGQSLLERMTYAPDGQVLSGSYMDYAMPRADMMPEIRFRAREVPTKVNPVGAKGVGEAGTVGSMVCIVNAICNALGVTHFEMPATPDRIWAALQAKETE
ncbi:MAG: xanthine dehydrogenase family protein molybdopterin-binding subunit [Paracoccaceae bacterium]|nr:xanthine dehydrogenase family protein molybdopterin-binding subunit [Paracoccaceae bacterium]